MMAVMGPKWLDALERRIGFLSIPELALFLAAMNAVVAILSFFKPLFPQILVFNPFDFINGQFWRALTFLFVPPEMSPIWLAFWLIFFYWLLNRLEQIWGDFRFLVYCLIGAASVVIASLLLGRELSDSIFVTSLILAFARLNSDVEILLFFFFPVKMRWIWAVGWVIIGWTLVFGSFSDRLCYALGVSNYLIFFGPEHWTRLRLAWRRSRSGLT